MALRMAASGCWCFSSAVRRPGQKSVGWRLLDVAKIEALTVLDETFPGSRGQLHRTHHPWEVVYARVK